MVTYSRLGDREGVPGAEEEDEPRRLMRDEEEEEEEEEVRVGEEVALADCAGCGDRKTWRKI